MPTPVVVPRFSLSMTSALISEWYQPDGASVGAGDPLFCVEADNVAFDVEATVAGVLRHRARAGLAYEPGEAAGVLLAIGERVPTELHPPAIPVAPTPVMPPPPSPPPGPRTSVRQREASPAPPPPALEKTTDGRAHLVVPLRRSRATLPPVPVSHHAFDRASRPDFDGDGPFAAPVLEPAAPDERSPRQEAAPVDDPTVRFAQPDAPVAPAGETSATPVAAAEPAPAPARIVRHVLTLGARVSFVEARKLTAQLRKEWRVRSLAPDDIDVVARAFGMAIEGTTPGGADAGGGIAVSVVNGESVMVPFGASAAFRDAVEARCRAAKMHGLPSHVELVSFAEAGIDEPCGDLSLGAAMRLSVGAVHPWPHTGGVRPVFGPHVSMVLAFDATLVPVPEAAAVFARLRELVESPYALLAA